MAGPDVVFDLDQASWLIQAAESEFARHKNDRPPRPKDYSPQSRIRHFELSAALTPGGNALAYPRDFDGTDDYTTDTGGSTFKVYDILGLYRGRAEGAFSSPEDTGSRGIAIKRNGLWQIVAMQPHALEIHALVNMGAGLGTGDSNITVDAVNIMNPIGAILVEGPITTIPNTFADASDDNSIVIASWDESAVAWKCIGVKCPA